MLDAHIWFVFPTVPPAVRVEAFVGCRQATNKIMLYGPPGTGKSSLAKACRVNLQRALGRAVAFVSITASSILSKFCGESEQALVRTFEQAKKSAPSILFFDELDSIAPCRDGGSQDKAMPRLLGELLVALSSLRPKDNVRRSRFFDMITILGVVILVAV